MFYVYYYNIPTFLSYDWHLLSLVLFKTFLLNLQITVKISAKCFVFTTPNERELNVFAIIIIMRIKC